MVIRAQTSMERVVRRAKRVASRRVWREWAERAQRDIGSLLAETIGMPGGSNTAIAEARDHMIRAETLLAEAIGK